MSTTLIQTRTGSKAARIAAIASRTLLGFIFLVFGLNGFLHFIPMQPMEGPAGAFAGGLAQSGYFFPMLKGFEVLIGVMLLTNRFVPLALVMLVPINLNIFLFHAFLGPQGMPVEIVLLALHIYLAYAYRSYYRSALVNKAVL